MFIILRAYGLSQRLKYEVFDTNTDSFLKADGILEKCVNYNNGVAIPAYPSKQVDTENYLVVSKIGEKFKLIKRTMAVAKVDVFTLDRQELVELIHQHKVINAQINDNKIILSGYYDSMESDIAYKVEVDKLYSKFLAKASLVGIDTSFHYRVEGRNVILTKYTGKSSKAIIPEFITSIGYMAFYKCEHLEQVEINSDIEYIGAYSFSMSNLDKIKIPRTVKFIGMNVFMGTKRLFNESHKLRADRVMIENTVETFMAQSF